MHIIVNGDRCEFESPLVVMELLQNLGLEPKKLAVERNRSIVPKSAYGNTVLSDGDKIEIVQFVGGG